MREGINFLIEKIDTYANPATLKAFGIDAPLVGACHDAALPIGGWIVPEPPFVVSSVEITSGELLLKRIPLDIARPDVARHLDIPEPSENKFGFYARLGSLGLPRAARLKLVAELYNPADQSRRRVEFSTLHGHRKNRISVSTKYQPVMLTALGRSGTTLLMQLLSEHRGILTSNFYPYEVKQASYWMHLLKVMSDPADFSNSSHPDRFGDDFGYIGHNPLFPPGEHPAVQNS